MKPIAIELVLTYVSYLALCGCEIDLHVHTEDEECNGVPVGVNIYTPVSQSSILDFMTSSEEASVCIYHIAVTGM